MAKRKSGNLFKAGLIGAAVGAVGSWFLFGTEAGKKKREEFAALGARIKNEVLAEAKNIKAENEGTYRAVVDSIAAKYRGLESVDPAVLTRIVEDLKNRWVEVKSQFEAGQGGPQS